MTIEKTETANGFIDSGSLYSELILAGLPVASVNDSLDSFFNISYLRNLSTEEATSAELILAAHTGESLASEPMQYQEILPKGGERVTDRGFQFDAIAGQTTTFDYPVTEELFVKQGFAIAHDFDKRDFTSMAIVHPALGPIHYYLKDIPMDIHKADKTVGIVTAENKAITETNFNGLIIRMTYKSHGTIDVHVCVTMRTYS